MQEFLDIFTIFVDYDHFYVNINMLTPETETPVFFTIFNCPSRYSGKKIKATPNIDLQEILRNTDCG